MPSLRTLKHKLRNAIEKYDELDAKQQQLKSEYTTLQNKETFYREEWHTVSGAAQKYEITKTLGDITARIDAINLSRIEIEQQLGEIDKIIETLEIEIAASERAARVAAGPAPIAAAGITPTVSGTHDINPIYKALLFLDYGQHLKHFQAYFPAQKRGVVLLGAAQPKRYYALKLLVRRLRQSIPELQPEAEDKQILYYHMQGSVGRLDADRLWDMLTMNLNEPPGRSHQEIGRKIATQLQSQHVVIEVHDQNNLFTELDDILQKFWQPLLEYADLKLQEIINPGLLILLLVDYCQHFVEHSALPEVLPLFVDRFERGHVEQWYYAVQPMLPRALKRPNCNDDEIWNKSNNGVPDDLLDFVSRESGFFIQRLLED